MRIVNVIFIFAVLLNTFHVAQNWKRIAGAEPHFSYTAPFLYFLRANHPSDFLAVETWYYFNDYLPFYEVLARATFGNPDYHPVSISPTIGKRQAMDFLPEYVITSWDIPFDELPGDYEQIASTPDDFTSILWQHNTTPPYAFTITRNQIAIRTRPIQREDTNPVQAFVHNIDHVQVWVDEYPPGSYLVITETAYPGWQVTINNQPARLESVGGLVGVELPERPEGTIEIHFSYKPFWLYIGSNITLITAAILTAYLLKIDNLLKKLQSFNV